jgi:hypothetical protein
LTSEVVDWLRKYSGDLGSKSQWLFPGYNGNRLTHSAASPNLKELFRRAGLEDSEDAIYSSHSFRTYTDSLLSRCRLDRKFIDMTVGHKAVLAAKINYQDWRECETQWLERCHNNMLIQRVQTVEILSPESLDLKDRIEELEGFNRELMDLLGIPRIKGTKPRALAELNQSDDSKSNVET